MGFSLFLFYFIAYLKIVAMKTTKTTKKQQKDETSLLGLLYVVILMSIFTNSIGVFSFIVGDSNFSSLSVVPQILILLLISLVWVMEAAIKTLWEKVFKNREYKTVPLIMILVGCSIIFSAWGLSYVGKFQAAKIIPEEVDRTELLKMQIELDSLKAYYTRLSQGHIKAYVSPSGILYRSGIKEQDRASDRLNTLQTKYDNLNIQLKQDQRKLDIKYEQKVQDFEFLTRCFSFIFQLVNVLLIFIINFKSVKKPIAKPTYPVVLKSLTRKQFKAKLDALHPDFKHKFKRTLFKPENFEMIYIIASNPDKSMQEKANMLNMKKPSIQNYSRYLTEAGLI